MKVAIGHLAKLSNLPISPKEGKVLSSQFDETLKVIANLNELNVKGINPTPQVTGLSNVTREDVIDQDRIFSQKEALANAQKSHKGYFVVPAIFE